MSTDRLRRCESLFGSSVRVSVTQDHSRKTAWGLNGKRLTSQSCQQQVEGGQCFHDGTYCPRVAFNSWGGDQLFRNGTYCPTVTNSSQGVGGCFQDSISLCPRVSKNSLGMGQVDFFRTAFSFCPRVAINSQHMGRVNVFRAVFSVLDLPKLYYYCGIQTEDTTMLQENKNL
jgi:hypothetical protein